MADATDTNSLKDVKETNTSPNASPLTATAGRDAAIVRTSIVGIVANVLLAGFKAAIGTITGSIAITLDAVNNLSDAGSSVITIVGTKLAGREPDREHPFGYGRIEYLTTIIISVIVMVAGVESLKESVARIIAPETASYDTVSLLIVAVAVAAKVTLGRYFIAQGKKLGSSSLVASGTDASMDSVISASTLVAALVYLATGIGIEAWLGAVIAVVIIKSGIDILREALSKILGERSEAELAHAVKKTVNAEPGVLGAYDLVLTDYGPDRYLASVHIEVAEDTTAREIDRMTREVTERVFCETGVILAAVGVYSANDDTSPDTRAITAALTEIVAADPALLQYHGLYVDEEQHTARFDLVVSFDVPTGTTRHEAWQRALIEMQRRFPAYAFTSTMDSDLSD